VAVILPIFLMVLLLFRSAAIDGADEGLKIYAENETDFDHTDAFTEHPYWQDTIGFVTRSLFAGTGVFIVYGSYNRRDKPVIMDTMIITASNFLFSFISGLATFMMVGYLWDRDDPNANDGVNGSVLFAFVTLPTAALGFGGSNFWTFVIYLILTTVTIDTAGAIVESVTCSISEVDMMKSVPRYIISGVVCFLGLFSSMIYTTNVGLYIFDIVVHFSTSYAIVLVIICELVVFGWYYNFAAAEKELKRNSMLAYAIGFWAIITLFPIISVYGFKDYRYLCIPIVMFLYPVVLMGSYLLNRDLEFGVWFKHIIFANVDKMADHMIKLGKQNKDVETKRWWESIFKMYFCIMIKYIAPVVFTFTIIFGLEDDFDKRYKGFYLNDGSYPIGTLMIGWMIVIITLMIIFVPAMFFTWTEDLGFDVDEPFQDVSTVEMMKGTINHHVRDVSATEMKRDEPARDISDNQQ